MDHVRAEHCEQRTGTAAVVHLGAPCRIGQIDPQRRSDIAKLRMRAPCGDAFEMRVVVIAWPPCERGRAAGKLDDVLPGAAAGLQHVAGFAGDEFFQHGPDRLVIAMERRRIKPAVRFDRSAVLAEFDDVVGHGTNPSFASPRNDVYVAARAPRTPDKWLEARREKSTLRAGFWRRIPPLKRAPLLGRRSFLQFGATMTGLALSRAGAETPASPPADAPW